MQHRSKPARAVRIFTFDEEYLDSPIASKVWRTRSEPVTSFTSVAVTHWEMVVTRRGRGTSLIVRGPETRATHTPIPQDTEFFGVEFRLGTFCPHVPVDRLADSALTLPEAGRRSFWLNGSAWEFPTFDNVDIFLRRLVRRGVVTRDPVAEEALQRRDTDLSRRSIQRRIRRATGLSHVLIRQIERAQRAVALLEGGTTILEVVERAGYADQPHLTRSLQRFIGHTPARIQRDASE